MNSLYFSPFLIFSLIILGLQGCSKSPDETEKAKIVMVVQPAQQQSSLQNYAGHVQAKQSTALAFRVGGQVTARHVDVGDRVKVGQVLATLDVKDADLQRNSARAQLEQAQATERSAKSELQRFGQLLPDNAVSRSQYDSVENQYKTALSNLKQAQANYEVAQNQTRYNQLIANRNGVITERNIEVGQVVSAGQAAYQIAIDGDREVVIGVPEQVIGTIRPQQQAWINLWSAPDQRYNAFVREIAPAADQSRTFMIKVAFRDQSPSIQLGQSARVFLNTEQQAQIRVPLSSVSAVNDRSYVWVVKPDQTLQRAWVTLGEYQRQDVPVLSGIQAGQWVVVGGVHLLREGQKVRAVDQDNRVVQITTTPNTPATSASTSAQAQTP